MKKLIIILAIIAVISAIIGFTFDFMATSFLRILSLLAADLAVILLLAKFFFFTEKGKIIRQRVGLRKKLA